MKKVLALVLVAVMALSLATVTSAFVIDNSKSDIVIASSTVAVDGADYVFGGDKQTIKFPLNPGASFTPLSTGSDAFATKVGTSEFTLSSSVTSSASDVIAASIESEDVKSGADTGKKYTLVLNPADNFFTVETKEIKVKVVFVQKESKAGSPTITFSKEFTIKVKNNENAKDLFFTDATGKVTSISKLTNPVVPEKVFTEIAKNKPLELNFGDYTVNFAKVVNQNTALYLKADTGVVAKPTKAIASIKFQPTRVKDAASITMPISADNENLYGEKVFVYGLVDSKPTGEAIEGTVVNHNSVIFTVPAGTALGTFAAYGDKVQGDAEKPAIPETGANDIVNIAIVFAVVALAAAGFVAVKKASK